jgi:hypothetical protein
MISPDRIPPAMREQRCYSRDLCHCGNVVQVNKRRTDRKGATERLGRAVCLVLIVC